MCNSDMGNPSKSEKSQMDDETETTNAEVISLNIRGTVITLSSEDIIKKKEFLKVISPYFKESPKQYVLHRDLTLIHSILDYFCGRKFHLPRGLCMSMVEEELNFWNIHPRELEYCCLNEFSRQIEKEKTNKAIRNGIQTHVMPQHSTTGVRYKVWKFLEVPCSSKLASLWAILISLACLVSIGILCVESIIIPEQPGSIPFLNIFNGSETLIFNFRHNLQTNVGSNYYWILGLTDMVLNVIMTIEVVLRVIVAYNRRVFFASVFTICDIIFVVLTWTSFFWAHVVMKNEDATHTEMHILSAVLVLSRLSRVPRLFYGIRHSKGLQILAWSIRASFKDLVFLTVLVFIIVTGFGILIYYAERGSAEFPNVFVGMWWALVTVTTVGYGDKFPTTPAGFIVGVCCAWFGVLTITLTVPIFATHFSNFYEHFNALYRIRAFKKRKSSSKDSALAPIHSIAQVPSTRRKLSSEPEESDQIKA